MKKNEYVTHSNNSTFQKPRQKKPGTEEQTVNDSIYVRLWESCIQCTMTESRQVMTDFAAI